MESWVRRTVALAALAGAAWLEVLARGVRGEARALLAPYAGASLVALAGLVASGLVALALLIVISPAGRRRGDAAPGLRLSVVPARLRPPGRRPPAP
jgi:hypothetical protein